MHVSRNFISPLLYVIGFMLFALFVVFIITFQISYTVWSFFLHARYTTVSDSYTWIVKASFSLIRIEFVTVPSLRIDCVN